MNLYYVCPSHPQHYGIIQQLKINARYPLECKYGTIQVGCHASSLIFVHSREVSLHINYTHLWVLLCNPVIVYLLLTHDFLSIYWHLLKFDLQRPNTRNLSSITYQGISMKSHNIIQVSS